MKEEEDVFKTLKRKCDEIIKLHKNATFEKNVPFCESVFDGLFCWPETSAGKLAEQNCSNDLLRSTRQGKASKQCTKNGTWFVADNNVNNATPWTNLTQCGTFYTVPNVTGAPPLDGFYQNWLPFVKNVSYFGYVLSVLALLASVCIFIKIKRLHCPRNKLHINLFSSFIMKSFMSLLKAALFVKGTTLSYETTYVNGEAIFKESFNYSWICKAIISVQWYFILANFMLMLMEGMYLHNLMFLNLFTDNHDVFIYCLCGWGLPVVFIIPWVIMKALYENALCWTKRESAYIALFIDLPIGISVVINFILFLLIVRVLFLKLNNACVQQRKIKYRKLLKATLILIPLFGIPYAFSLVISMYIYKSALLEMLWLFFDQTFAAFQGLFAALIYCLLNGEVQVEIKRKYSSLKDRTDKEFRRSRTISNTQQFSLQTNEDLPDNLHCFGNGLKGNPEEIVVAKENHRYF